MPLVRRHRFSIAALVAAMLFVATSEVLAAVQQGADIPSADIVPTDTTSEDPNFGQWFFLQLAPGQTATFHGLVRNPADVVQTVNLYLADLIFSNDGTPTIKDGKQDDIGAWGRSDRAEVNVPAKGSVEAAFTITAPKEAEPGDHIGAVVAQSQPQIAGTFKVVKRSGTRIYVTVPGDARRGFEISWITKELDNFLFPRNISVSALLRNTGRVRLEMVVTAGGKAARGPKLLLSQSAEHYYASVAVPFYGGPVSYPIEAVDARSGLIRRESASTFVVPWGLLILVVIGGSALWSFKRMWDRRASRWAHLQTDIRRLEALVAQRPTGPVAGTPVFDLTDEIGSITTALKRARRTGSHESLERLALALHEAGGEALDVLLESLESASEASQPALIRAAASYGAAAVVAHAGMVRLPADLAAEISITASRAEIGADSSPEAVVEAQRDRVIIVRAPKKRDVSPPRRAKRKPPGSQRHPAKKRRS